MGCGAPLKRALEGLDGVKAVEMRFPKKEFEVQYDPEQVTTGDLLATATNKGRFQSKVDGAIQARIDAPGLKLEASTHAGTHAKASKGSIEVRLTPEAGKALTKVNVSVSGEKPLSFPKSKVTLKEVSEPEGVSLQVTIGRKASAGEYVAVLEVTYQDAKGDAKQARLSVLIRVN